MKFIRVFLLFLIFSASARGQAQNDFGRLKMTNEEVVIAFRLAKSEKYVVLCRDVSNTYLIYRFGTKDNLELVYPNMFNTKSWNMFTYYGYRRGGGVSNEAMRDYWLSFTNHGVVYTVYEDWHSTDNLSHVGVRVKVDGKETDMAGDLDTKTGTLQTLSELDISLPNKANE